jgi:hypothetical protein
LEAFVFDVRAGIVSRRPAYGETRNDSGRCARECPAPRISQCFQGGSKALTMAQIVLDGRLRLFGRVLRPRTHIASRQIMALFVFPTTCQVRSRLIHLTARMRSSYEYVP